MKKIITEKILITPRELAVWWEIGLSAIYMFRSGTEQLKRYRFGRSIRFEIAEVKETEKNLFAKKSGRVK